MACRQGCRTKDHSSYAECLRSANVQVGDTINSPLAPVWDATKSDLVAYRTARANGIQPGATRMKEVRAAEDATRLLGRPYNAEKDPPADMIVNKNSARFVRAMED